MCVRRTALDVRDPDRQPPEEVEHLALLVAILQRIVDEDFGGLVERVEGARLLRGDIDLELDRAHPGGQPLAEHVRELVAGDAEPGDEDPLLVVVDAVAVHHPPGLEGAAPAAGGCAVLT